MVIVPKDPRFRKALAAPGNRRRRKLRHSSDRLVLTERTDHLENIRRSLEEHNLESFVLHGRMPKKQRANLVAEIDELPPAQPPERDPRPALNADRGRPGGSRLHGPMSNVTTGEWRASRSQGCVVAAS
jgi:hypothetical protein